MRERTTARRIRLLDELNERVAFYYSQVDDFIAKQAAEHGGAACSKGCAHCCYILACATVGEVILTAYCAQQNGHIVDNELVKHQTQAIFTVESSLAWKKAREPCTFLRADNTCAGYAFRPMVCRTHTALTEPEFCAGYERKTAMLDTRRFAAERMVQMSVAINRQLDLPFIGVAPLPIAVLIANTYLRSGRKATIRLMEKYHMDDEIGFLSRISCLDDDMAGVGLDSA